MLLPLLWTLATMLPTAAAMEAMTATKRIAGRRRAPTTGHAGGRRRGHCAAGRGRMRAGGGGAAGASAAGDGRQRWRETLVVWGTPPPRAARRALVWELRRVERRLRRCRGRGPMGCDVAAVTATAAPLRRLLRHLRWYIPPRQWPTRHCSRRRRQRQRRHCRRCRHPLQQHRCAGRRPRRLGVGRQPPAGLACTIRTLLGAPHQCAAALALPRTLRRLLAASDGGLGRRARG